MRHHEAKVINCHQICGTFIETVQSKCGWIFRYCFSFLHSHKFDTTTHLNVSSVTHFSAQKINHLFLRSRIIRIARAPPPGKCPLQWSQHPDTTVFEHDNKIHLIFLEKRKHLQVGLHHALRLQQTFST
eukprot:Filipodium_phascolosomae@DN2765_c0_g1_i16.p1